MLTRVLVASGTASCLLLPAAPAFANGPPTPPPIQVSGDNQGGYVSTVVQVPGKGPVSASDASNLTSSDDGVHCTWKENSTHLEDLYMHWVGWGEPGGHWYDIRCSDGTMYFSIYVPPAPNNVPAPLILANAIAQRAANRLPLPSPGVRHNPRGDALVNFATWWWIDPREWRPLSQRTSAGPVWVRVTARPVKSVWDAGDGTSPLTCRGGGTPYEASKPAAAQSTGCSHTYEASSAGQPQSGSDPNDRFYTVTVTVYWQVSFVGAGGARGALPVMTRTARFPLRVVEREAVVTGGSG